MRKAVSARLLSGIMLGLSCLFWFHPCEGALVVEQSVGSNLANVPGTTALATWSVEAGDVVVLTGAHNAGDEDMVLVSSSSDGAALGVVSELSESGTGPKAEVQYATVTAPGTLELSITKVHTAYTTCGLYLLRAGSDEITMLDSDTYKQGTTENLSFMTNSYAFSESTGGILIEAASTYDVFTLDSAMTELEANSSSSPKRVAAYRSFSGLTSLESIYEIANPLKQVALAGLVFSEVGGSPLGVDPYSGTNVLFIAIDDWKPIAGCYGDTLVQTPNIDSLAAAGTVFRNNHCQWAVCGPSRASIMTGLMPEETGVMGFQKMRHNDTAQLHDLITLPQHFKNNGYETVATGKINDNRCVGTINPDGTVNDDGSTYDDPPSWSLPYVKAASGSVGSTTTAWAHDTGSTAKLAAESVDAPDSDFSDGQIALEGLDLLDSLSVGEKPFFLGVGFKKPHLPFLAPKQYWDAYQRDDFSIHPHQTGILNETAYTFNGVTELRDNYYMETDGQGYALQLTGGQLPTDIQKELLHGYYASISFIDAQVGLLLDRLETLGLATNTIIVLWGDHGFHLGDHNEWGKHSNLEQASRSPLIIYSPWHPAGHSTDSPSGFIDIYPTLCELAGLSVPEQPIDAATPTGRSIHGQSLVPLLDNPISSVRNGIITQYGSNNAGYAYRTDRYRYTEWIDSSGNLLAQELYDYETDPWETINLANEVTSQNMMYDFSLLMRTEAEAGGAERLLAAAPMPVPTNSVPEWSADPVVEIAAVAGAVYSSTLADDASDEDGNQTLVFTKGVGPEWLQVDADGTLSGRPTDLDVGLNQWTVQVDDTYGGISTSTLEVQVNFGSIPQSEYDRIEAEFGITLSAQEKADLDSVVNPSSLEQWRLDAYGRIRQSRMAHLDLRVVDDQGTPLDGAQISVKLKNHAFKWAGTLGAKDMFGAGSSRVSTAVYQDLALSMFNSVGLNNGFKPRLTGIHQYLPGLMSWASSNEIPVRGHLLLWPGTGDLADLDDPQKVSGVDYGGHLSQSSTSDYAHYNVLGAVDTYKASARTQADVDAVEAEVDAEIAEWAAAWDVYEWDVINETLGNTLLMQIMGYDQMAEWFKIASSNKVNPDCKLMINDYQIISSMSESRTPGWYAMRRDLLMVNIDQVLVDGGPIDGIGFQSRIKQERRDPQLIWDRLEEWGNRYGLMMVGTEFEVVSSNPGDWKEYIYTDLERAEITDEMMTQYFSHPLVTGFTAWNFMHDADPALIDYDGAPNLNGLVWYYIHRIRYMTDESRTTAADGWAEPVFGFLGEYDIVVTYGGQDYPASITMSGDKAVQLELQVSNQSPVWDQVPYTAQDALEDASYSRWINWVASDSDGDPLTFSMISGPSWVSLSSNGQLTGVPTQLDVGTNVLQVSVSDGQNPAVANTVYIEVLNVNDVPAFSSDPLIGPGAVENTAYTSSLSGWASDEDGDDLTYVAISGPAWLSVAADGALSGMPANGDVGINSWTVQVTDGNGGTNSAGLQIMVDAYVNQPPSWNQNPYNDSQQAVEDALFTRWINWLATDPESDALTFAKVSGPAWLALTNPDTGRFDGTPGQADVGLNVFVVSISDGINPSVEMTWNLTVVNVNDDPIFSADPISGSDGEEDMAYTGTVSGSATDEDGDTLIYSKVSGPAWLNVAGDGALTGTPQVGDSGLNSFIVQVDDGNGGVVTAALEIIVNEKPLPLPGLATSPTPGDGSRNINTPVTLSWDAASDATTYQVYFGTDSANLSLVSTQVGTSWATGSLPRRVWHYWRVDAVNSAGTTTGTVWRFRSK